MLKIYTAYNNKQIVKEHAQAKRIDGVPGYDATFIISMNGHDYRLDINGFDYFLTFEDEIKQGHCIYFKDITNGSITIDNARTWNRGARDKTIHSERLLKKYQQLALMVHGIVASNMLLTA